MGEQDGLEKVCYFYAIKYSRYFKKKKTHKKIQYINILYVFYVYWRGRRGSNPRPSDRQSDVLTKLNYVPKCATDYKLKRLKIQVYKMVGGIGLEPMTSSV